MVAFGGAFAHGSRDGPMTAARRRAGPVTLDALRMPRPTVAVGGARAGRQGPRTATDPDAVQPETGGTTDGQATDQNQNTDQNPDQRTDTDPRQTRGPERRRQGGPTGRVHRRLDRRFDRGGTGG